MLLWAWPSLPERYPMHFNIEGAPDAWVSRSPGTILFSLGMHLFLLAAMSFGIARPDHANIPGRVRLGELAADTQREMMRRIQVALAFIAICASALVAWVGIGQVLVALGTWPRLMSFPIGFIVGAMLATIGWISVDILRAVRASRPH